MPSNSAVRPGGIGVQMSGNFQVQKAKSDFIRVIPTASASGFRPSCQGAGQQSARIRITSLKEFIECGVVPVYIIVEVNEAVLCHDGSPINDQDRN